MQLDLGRRTYLLNDPVDIKHVLIDNAANYDKSPRITGGRGRRFSGLTLLSSGGAAHDERRRRMQPLFHPRAARAALELADLIVATARETAQGWANDSAIDVRREMLTLTKTVISRVLFGADFADPSGAWSWAIGARCRHFESILLAPVPFPERWPTPANAAGRRARRIIDRVIAEQIERVSSETAVTPSLLRGLLQLRDAAGVPLPAEVIRDEVISLAMAGFETNAEALTWTWYLLGRHPDAQEQVRAEARAAGGQCLRAGDLTRLVYTRAVVDESLRLYPPTWLFVRLALARDTLPSGYAVPAGTQIYCSQWVTQRDPRYFPEPEQFHPERFLDNSAHTRPKLTYFPFGGGPRTCIGESIATMENVLAVASIASQYELTPLDQRPVVPEPGIALRPGRAIHMRVLRR